MEIICLKIRTAFLKIKGEKQTPVCKDQRKGIEHNESTSPPSNIRTKNCSFCTAAPVRT